MGGRFRGKSGVRGGRAASDRDVESSSKEIRINVVIPTQQESGYPSSQRPMQQEPHANEMIFDDCRQFESRQSSYRNQRQEHHDPIGDFNVNSRDRDFFENQRPGPQANRRFDVYGPERSNPILASQRGQRFEYYQDSGTYFDRGPPPAMTPDVHLRHRPSEVLYLDRRLGPHADPRVANRNYGSGPGFDNFQNPVPHHHSSLSSYRPDPARLANRAENAYGIERGPPRSRNDYGPGFIPDSNPRYPPIANDMGFDRPPPYESHHFEIEGGGGRDGVRGRGRARGRGEGDGRGRARGRGDGDGRGRARGRGEGDGRGCTRGRGQGFGGERRGRGKGIGGDLGKGQEGVREDEVYEVTDSGDGKKNRMRKGKKDISTEATESKERSSSTKTTITVSSSKQANKPSVKESTEPDCNTKYEFCETKSSISIKRNFEKPAELKKILEKHFDKKKIGAQMNFLEGTIIFSEKESTCIITVSASSKQEAKRLIKSMCQGIYHDLKVPCYFCVSSWKKDTGNKTSKSPWQSESMGDQDEDKIKNVPSDTIPKSTKTVCKGKNEATKKANDNKATKKKNKPVKESFQTVFKIAITITKGFESNQQLVAFLKKAAGEMGSKISEELESVSLLNGLTVCETMIADEGSANEITKNLNQVPGVKATSMPHELLNKQEKEETNDIKSVIKETSEQINELIEKELANHESKICQTGRSLLDLQSLLLSEKSGNDTESAQEVSTLMGKLRDLDSQKKEFEIRIEELKASLSMLEHNSASKEDVDNILRDVGIECKRLSAGFLRKT